MLICASVSMFGHLGGMTLSVPRIVYALARDGYLPRALAVIDPANRAPRAAIIAMATLTLIFAVTNTFENLVVLANVSVLALYFGCAIASWRLGQSPIVPILACVVIAWLCTGLKLDEWIAFIACIGVATLVYAIRRSAAGARVPAES